MSGSTPPRRILIVCPSALGDVCRDYWPLIVAGGIGVAATLPRWLAMPGRVVVWPFIHADLRWRQLPPRGIPSASDFQGP